MTHADPSKRTPPSLSDLMVGFMNRPADAAAIEAEAGALGEVEPHEVSVGFRVDPRLAWQEGLAAFEVFGLAAPKLTAPAEWAAVVVRHESIAAQPFALANYPQRVRDLAALIQAKDLSGFRRKCESQPAAALAKWSRKHAASDDASSRTLVAAVLRNANDLDAAADILNAAESAALIDNERAALLWQRGEWEQAAQIWDRLPENTAISFNRGMAALFLGQTSKARESLKKAIALLPESSGWHHLASLYLALAEIRT